MFRKMTVVLSNSSARKWTLSYRIRSKPSAQLWAERVSLAAPSGLKEKNRFYNFPGQENSQISHWLKQLEAITDRLKALHPELRIPPVNPHNLQESVNELHVNFAHSHLTAHLITPENSKDWTDFNVALHAIEATLRNQELRDFAGMNTSRIVFTWNENQRVPIPEEVYEDFEISYQFGSAYANYSQVGRHLLEMFNAKDDQLKDEHIQPSRFISGDTFLWFGPDFGHLWSARTYREMQAWFRLHQERLNRLGLEWGDPKLALGYIPVARLEDGPVTRKEINAFVADMAIFDRVESVLIE